MTLGGEGKGGFAGFIDPKTLLRLVRNTAPYLFDGDDPAPAAIGSATRRASLYERAFDPLGWWSVIRGGDMLTSAPAPDPHERTDYFALCLAAHFATVTTFVPTDVDTKIRDALWFAEPRDPRELRRMAELALALGAWEVSRVSARIVSGDEEGPVSGHDGERLSVLAGGHLGLLAAGDDATAGRLAEAIDGELAREGRIFERARVAAQRAAGGRDPRAGVRLCILAAHLTHNVGDVDQGLGAKGGQHLAATAKSRFGRLAHEGAERYGGAFARAAAVYRAVMAPEGHRNYPLRELRPLRKDPALLLPVSPFLDAWGETLATFRGLRSSERAELVGGLVSGCRKVAGQEGYYRALCGFGRAFSGGLGNDELNRALPAAQRKELRDSELRRKLSVSKESFESSLVKRALGALRATLEV